MGGEKRMPSLEHEYRKSNDKGANRKSNECARKQEI